MYFLFFFLPPSLREVWSTPESRIGLSARRNSLVVSDFKSFLYAPRTMNSPRIRRSESLYDSPLTTSTTHHSEPKKDDNHSRTSSCEHNERMSSHRAHRSSEEDEDATSAPVNVGCTTSPLLNRRFKQLLSIGFIVIGLWITLQWLLPHSVSMGYNLQCTKNVVSQDVVPIVSNQSSHQGVDWRSYLERVYHQPIGDRVVDTSLFTFFYNEMRYTVIENRTSITICRLSVHQGPKYNGTPWIGTEGPEGPNHGKNRVPFEDFRYRIQSVVGPRLKRCKLAFDVLLLLLLLLVTLISLDSMNKKCSAGKHAMIKDK